MGEKSRESGSEGPIPGICVIDAEGRVVGWSRRGEEILGWRAADILGRPGTDLRMELDRAVHAWAWTGGAGDPDYRVGIVDLRHRDGTPVVARTELSRITTLEGPPAWVAASVPAAETPKEASVLEPLLSGAPVVLAVWDADLRSVWLNRQARGLERMFAYFTAARPPADIPAETGAPSLPDLIRRVFDDGVPVMDREARWPPGDRAGQRTFSTFLFRVEGLDGRPLGVCLLAIDITHSRARERLAVLRQASVQIGTTLDVRQTAQELADLAVGGGFTDYIAVDLTEEVYPGPQPLQRLEATDESVPAFLRAGLASIHPGVPEALWRLGDPVYVPPSSPYTEVLESGRPYFEPVIGPSMGMIRHNDPGRARIIEDFGIHTMMIVPLKARGRLLGITLMFRHENKTSFTTDDVVLAEEVADRAALSLDNARQYTREHAAAVALQRQLLPRKLSGGAALDLASRYLPSDVHEGVGGDWYDVIPLPGSRVALVVGDVTGHGINAAASMGSLRTAMRTLAYLGLPPDELLTRLDAVYAREAEEEDGLAESPIAATCLYAVYDPATRRCAMASAGHPPPAVVHPSGQVRFPTLTPGTPIGLGLAPHPTVELELDAGALMVLYTDGLIERRGSDLDEGMRRLSTALLRTAVPLDDLCTNLIQTMVAETAEDDVTLLLARTRPPAG